MEQYRLLAECLLPARMLDWFDLKNVRVEKKGDTQVIHRICPKMTSWLD